MLKAIAESGRGRNAAIKGGVVMSSISKNALIDNHRLIAYSITRKCGTAQKEVIE